MVVKKLKKAWTQRKEYHILTNVLVMLDRLRMVHPKQFVLDARMPVVYGSR